MTWPSDGRALFTKCVYSDPLSSWSSRGIKWKERQERRLKLEAPKMESVNSPLHAQTGNDVTRVYYLSELNIIKIIVIYTADIARVRNVKNQL